MTITDTTAPTVDEVAEQVFGDALGTARTFAMYLGDRLGLYRALAAEGPLTARELATRTGVAERYAREWLEHQAVNGLLGTDGDGDSRRFALSPAHAEVLTDTDSLAFLAPMGQMFAAVGGALPDLLDAYRTGGGVSWERLGADAREGQALLNRPMFLHQLTQEFLPAIPDVHERLGAPGARIADVGCGEGWSSIGFALGYPDAVVDGFDVDAASVAAARRHAAAHGVDDRVRFHLVDAAGDTGESGSYDAVFAFECVHDLGDPVGVLATMRRLAAPGAPVLVMDERTEPAFTAPAGPVEQMLYGWSVLVCLPDGLSHPHSAGTGTVMRPDTLAAYAREAGFTGADPLDAGNDFLRFYRLA